MIDKPKRPFSQLILYFFVGAAAAAIDIPAFMLFTSVLSVDYRIALFLSFTLGTLTNFFLCNAFVFDRQTLPFFNSMGRHYVSSLGGLVTNEVVAILLVEALFFRNLFVVKVLATISAFFVNFTLIKFFAFNHKVKIIGQ